MTEGLCYSSQVNAVSRMRLELGRYTETHNGQSPRRIAHKNAIDESNLQKQLELISFIALANRNAKAGVNPNPGTD